MHTEIHKIMERRGVLTRVRKAYIRDKCSTRMVFKHSLWATDEVAPRMSLRQVCCISPLAFVCTMEDLLG